MKSALTAGKEHARIIRFAINGLVATGVHYAVLVTLVEGMQIALIGLANGIAACFGIATSYVGNRLFVFRSQAPVINSMAAFAMVYGFIAIVHFSLLTIWSDIGGFTYTPGFLLATALCIVLAYIGNRNIVFAGHDAP